MNNNCKTRISSRIMSPIELTPVISSHICTTRLVHYVLGLFDKCCPHVYDFLRKRCRRSMRHVDGGFRRHDMII